MPEAVYDTIGVGYSAYRRPDPRLAAHIDAALGAARTVVNVGAGAGSYEPVRRQVVAVEPSAVMVQQRPPGSAPAVRASAAALPFRDAAFDAALAILTVHHWLDWRRGLAELRRVARNRVVLFTWDPEISGFWLTQEYFPDVLETIRHTYPSLAAIADVLGPLDIKPVPIPADCSDGFLGAYWRRPAAYLDPGIRGAMSPLARVRESDPRLTRLAADLTDGTWTGRHGALLGLPDLDIGYRLVVAQRSTVLPAA
jgi:SAM-dependent methyltransferase